MKAERNEKLIVKGRFTAVVNCPKCEIRSEKRKEFSAFREEQEMKA